MNSFWAALKFLTVCPLPAAWGREEKALAQSVPWFPVIGGLLGLLAAGGARLLQPFVPQPLLCALLVIGLAAVSGALHLDGLSDTADGLLSSRLREQMLEIMRDSHVGAMGVLAIVCVLLLKFSALLALPPAVLWKAVWLMPLAGRGALAVHLACLPYVRPQGLGRAFSGRKPWGAALGGMLLLGGTGWLLLGLPGLAAAGASLGMTLLAALYFYRKLGGATGDTYGAACELAEIMPPLTLALFPWAR